VLLHQLGEHLAFPLQFAFELLDLAILGCLDGLALPIGLECQMPVLEKRLLPTIEHVRRDLQLLADR
jgi:hypothetical protein